MGRSRQDIGENAPFISRFRQSPGLFARRFDAQEHVEDALSVRPDDIPGTAQALHKALLMPSDQRCDRAFKLRRALLRHDLNRWLYLLLEDMERIKVDKQRRSAMATYAPARSLREDGSISNRIAV